MFYTSEIYCQFQCGKKKKKKIILPLIKLLHNLKIKGRKNTSFLHKLSTISTILARLHQGGKRHRPILPCTKILRPVNWTTKGPVESRQFTKTKDPRSYKVISCSVMAFHLAVAVAPPRLVHGRCAAWFTRGGRAATALISFATKYMGSRCQLLNVSRGSTGARKLFATRLTVLARSSSKTARIHLVSFRFLPLNMHTDRTKGNSTY